ncbi:tau-tubulin kinase like protein Asator [Ditylenchus destructor]|nr:tau-tubulin kinase like protein Asator [Ditylenchus destructor]
MEYIKLCKLALEHGIGYLHRDIKPGNYTIGRAELNELRKVYILDFGLARKFTNEQGVIRRPRQAVGFRSTVRYAPISCIFSPNCAASMTLKRGSTCALN